MDFQEFFTTLNEDMNITGYSEESATFLLESSFKYAFLKISMDLITRIFNYASSHNLRQSFKYGNGIKSMLIRLLLESRRYSLLLNIAFEDIAGKILFEYFPYDMEGVTYLRNLCHSFAYFALPYGNQSSGITKDYPYQSDEVMNLDLIISELEQAKDLCDVDFPIDVMTTSLTRIIPLLLCICDSSIKNANSSFYKGRIIEIIKHILCRGKYYIAFELLNCLLFHGCSAYPYDDIDNISEDKSLSPLERQIVLAIESRSFHYRSDEIIKLFLQPEFMTMLCWLILDKERFNPAAIESTNRESDEDKITPIQSSALSLLSRCLEPFIHQLQQHQHQPEVWMKVDPSLYKWLQAIVWRFHKIHHDTKDNDADSLNEIQMSIETIDRLITVMECFAFQSSSVSKVDETIKLFRNNYFKALVLGLFHHESSIRQESSLLLRHHILGESNEELVDQDDDNESVELRDWLTSSNFVTNSDEWESFYSGSNSVGGVGVVTKPARTLNITGSKEQPFQQKQQQQQPMKKGISPIRNGGNKQLYSQDSSFKKAIFNHQDLNKLCILVFDETMEMNIRQSAIQQLKDMLLSDQQLLLTCSKVWIVELLQKLWRLYSRFMFSNSTEMKEGEKEEVELLLSNTGTSRVQLQLATILSSRKVECDFYSQTIFLMYHLLRSYPGVLEYTSFVDMTMMNTTTTTAEDKDQLSSRITSNGLSTKMKTMNISSLLNIVFQAELLFKQSAPSTMATSTALSSSSLPSMMSDGVLFLRRSAYLSLAILHLIVFDSNQWKLSMTTAAASGGGGVADQQKLYQLYLPTSTTHGMESHEEGEVVVVGMDPSSTSTANGIQQQIVIVPKFLIDSYYTITFKHPQSSVLLDAQSMAISNVIHYRIGTLIVASVIKPTWPARELIETALGDLKVPSRQR